MSAATDRPASQPPRPECRDDAEEMSTAECRFRATARRIAVQLDIEETMWRMLEKEPNQ